MNQSHSSLITSFFKSETSQSEEEDDSVVVAVSNGVMSHEEEDGGGGGEDGGGRDGRNLEVEDEECEECTINLNTVDQSDGKFNHHPLFTPSTRTSSLSPLNCRDIPISISDSCRNGMSTDGSGMRQGTVIWNTANGTLSLTSLTTIEPPASSPPPPPPGDTEANERGLDGEKERPERRKRRKRKKRNDTMNKTMKRKKRRIMKLVVKIKREFLRDIPGQPSDDCCLHSEPESDNDVMITGTHPSQYDLNQSVVILSPPPPPPSSGTLSGAWAKIFSKPVKKDSSSRKPATPPASPVRSPRKRVRRSTSCSPRRLCGSPRTTIASPLKSSLPGSPLKNSLLPRQLLPGIKRVKIETDHAPYSRLVHVRQEERSDPFWTLTSDEASLKLRTTATSSSSSSSSSTTSLGSLSSCLSPMETIRGNHTPLITPVTSAKQQEAIMQRLTGDYPQENVHQIYQRYRRLRRGGVVTHLDAPPTEWRRRRKEDPLMCKIRITTTSRRGRVRVDFSGYGVNGKKRSSLRLNRNSVDRELNRVNGPVEKELTAGQERTTEAGKEEEKEVLHGDMWTELYHPRSRSEFIGNKVKVQQLYNWLETWSKRSKGQEELPPSQEKKRRRRKLRERESSSPTPEWAADEQEFISLSHLHKRRRRRRTRIVMSSSGSEPDGESEDDGEEEEEEELSPAVFLCGPVGSGKTAAVHACAAELGCKVFEVNSSSIRSRGPLMSILKEATLSHQVSLQPSVGVVSQNSSEKEVKVSSGKEVKMATSQKTKKIQVNSLTSFFGPVKEKKKKKKEEEEKENVEEKERGDVSTNSSRNCRHVSLESYTIILLEEVDVLFDSDRGFWSGVYDLIAGTRRPLILTSNDSRFKMECNHIKIVFEPPSQAELGMHLQLLSLSHDYHMTSDMALRLGDYLNSDLRRIFLTLHFWLNTSSSSTTSTSTFSTSTSSTSTSSSVTLYSVADQKKRCFPIIIPKFPLPRLPLPWQPSVKPYLATSDLYHNIDVASQSSELHSFLDVMATSDGGMGNDDDIDEMWWKKKEENAGLQDELGEKKTRWREEEVEEGVCEEVERRIGESVLLAEDPISKINFTRHVRDVRKTLEKCSKIFSLNNGPVGVVTDGLPLLRSLSSFEHQRRLSHTKRRFRHYLQHCATVEQTDFNQLTLSTRFPTN